MKSMIKGLLAGLCFAAPGLLLAQSETGGQQPQTGASEEQGSAMHQRWMSHQISSQTPTELNRASKIIGADVVSQTNTKLGVVRDLIVDPKSQRVAYAWVEKSDETANTGKYLAVPVHLLTKEAMGLYLKHLQPHGILAFHVSNSYLNLAPVVRQLADVYGKQSTLLSNKGNTDEDETAADWVLVADASTFKHLPEGKPIRDRPDLRLWTDDYSSLTQVLKREK